MKKFLAIKIIGIVILVCGILYAATIPLPIVSQQYLAPMITKIGNLKANSNSEQSAEMKEKLEVKIRQLNKKLNVYKPKGNYLIINSTKNEFRLCNGDKVLREGKCSTGKNLQLEKGDKKKWIFKTPKGELSVRGKKTNPVWTKPDWAFVEEGLPVPSPSHPSRFEENVLGDYALTLGDGYMIHGTIWQRYLGLAVTHGCVRLNDDDLEVVYKALDKGSKVYIY